MFERGTDGPGRDFVKADTKNLLGVGRRNVRGQPSVRGCPFGRLGVRSTLALVFVAPAVLSSRSLRFHEAARLREPRRQVRGNGFALAIRVRRQVDRLRGVRRLPQVMNDFAFARDDLQRRLENLLDRKSTSLNS